MKKTYQKPMMAVEQFALTQSIATCETKIGFLSSECVKKDPDATEQMKDFAYSGFFTEAGSCDQYAIGMDDFDKICYHTNAGAAFNS